MKMRIVDELRDIIEGTNAMAYLPVPPEIVPEREVMADKWELLLEFFKEQRNRRSLDADSPVEFLGPRQSGNRAWLYVLRRGEYDSLALMGSITAAKRPGEHAWLTFRLGGFPDPDLFGRTVDDLIEEMRRQGFIASQPTPAEEGAGDFTKGELVRRETLPLDLATFRGLLATLDDLTCKPGARIGTLVWWEVSALEGTFSLGYVTALPTRRGDIVVGFYKMEWDTLRNFPPTPVMDNDGTVSPQSSSPGDAWTGVMVNVIMSAVERLLAQPATPAQDAETGDVKPDPPPMDAPHDDWFRWYHKVTDLGYRLSLKELSSKMGLSYGYVRQLNSRYMAEHHK